MPDISFVIPFRNEQAYLPKTLESLAGQQLGTITAEILLVDGDSNDRSREIIAPFLEQRSGSLTFRVLENPARTTPCAFNIGIRESRAEIVGFGGAHTMYPPSYLRRAAELLGESQADVVGGGFDRFVSSEPGTLGRAMSCLYQSPMGAGVAAYHRRTTPGDVDTVYGGFYRRSVFTRIGGFDERLTRNQDNELNARVKAAGYRIFFHPDLSTTYVQKTDLRSFVKRGAMFGRYHPLTWRANLRSFRLRHALPAMFAVYSIALLLLLATQHLASWFVAPLLAYLLLLVWSAVRLSRRVPVAAALATIPVFWLFHVAYGVGTLAGLPSLLRVRVGQRERQVASQG